MKRKRKVKSGDLCFFFDLLLGLMKVSVSMDSIELSEFLDQRWRTVTLNQVLNIFYPTIWSFSLKVGVVIELHKIIRVCLEIFFAN